MAFSGGSGTVSDPFLIASMQDLNDVRNFLNSNFKVIKDLDVSDWNDGNGWTPIGVVFSGDPFIGIFDGNGHIIRNISMASTGADEQGLFAFIDGATVRNVGFEDVNIERNISGSLENVGVVCGRADGNYLIEKCYVGSGSVSFLRNTNVDNVGGILGFSNSETGIVQDCYVASSVTADNNVGGIVGRNDGIIRRCYASGDVGTGTLGSGITAQGGTISNCVAAMDEIISDSPTLNVRRISSGGGTRTNNFALDVMTFVNSPADSDADGRDGLSKTLSELTTKSTYSSLLGWDFADTWQIESGQFPTLRVFNRIALDPYFFGSNF